MATKLLKQLISKIELQFINYDEMCVLLNENITDTEKNNLNALEESITLLDKVQVLLNSLNDEVVSASDSNDDETTSDLN